MRIALQNSGVWVAGVVLFQLFGGLIGAVILNQRFPGRAAVRGLALIPWATTSVLVALWWTWMLDGNYGLLSDLLLKSGILSRFQPWLAQPGTALPAVMLADVWQGIPSSPSCFWPRCRPSRTREWSSEPPSPPPPPGGREALGSPRGLAVLWHPTSGCCSSPPSSRPRSCIPRAWGRAQKPVTVVPPGTRHGTAHTTVAFPSLRGRSVCGRQRHYSRFTPPAPGRSDWLTPSTPARPSTVA